MEIGFIGLGRMGLNMVTRLARGGHRVFAFSPSGTHRQAVEEAGGTHPESLAALVAALAPPRTVWLMVPAGQAVDENIEALLPLLSPGDLIVDGGNSNYRTASGGRRTWRSAACSSSTPAPPAASGDWRSATA